MERLVHGENGGYPVWIRRGGLQKAGELLTRLSPRRWAVVSDTNVAPLYGDTVLTSLHNSGLKGELFTVPPGEASKTPGVYETLCRALARAGLSRDDGVLALGGGAVGDLAGFAAATYLRGVALVQAPTTLLAQADSAIGGKTGLDLPEGKNLLGAFRRPEAVIIDPDCLDTLPARQLSSGAAEAIKCGMIADSAILDLLETPAPDWETILPRCLEVKIRLVERDEQDRGERRLLNFGHTFGHAYEALGGYTACTHGEAVAAGMAQMLRWQLARGEDVAAAYERLISLLEKFALPAHIDCDAAALADCLARDKKAAGGMIDAVVLEGAGAAVCRRVPLSALWEAPV